MEKQTKQISKFVLGIFTRGSREKLLFTSACVRVHTKHRVFTVRINVQNGRECIFNDGHLNQNAPSVLDGSGCVVCD